MNTWYEMHASHVYNKSLKEDLAIFTLPFCMSCLWARVCTSRKTLSTQQGHGNTDKHRMVRLQTAVCWPRACLRLCYI